MSKISRADRKDFDAHYEDWRDREDLPDEEEQCPMVESGGDDCECEKINKFYCPFASIPHMEKAIIEEYDECPLSWQIDER